MVAPAGLDASRRFTAFIGAFLHLLQAQRSETELLRQGADLLKSLVAQDDWLPPAFAVPHTDRYGQYLLHRDPQARFSVISFAWGPGQKTPVHDHRVWGLIGMLRGAEDETRYTRRPDGKLGQLGQSRLLPGQVQAVSQHSGDIHQVCNAFGDRPSVSIHVYGADIGAVSRHVYDPVTGTATAFVSGYSNA